MDVVQKTRCGWGFTDHTEIHNGPPQSHINSYEKVIKMVSGGIERTQNAEKSQLIVAFNYQPGLFATNTVNIHVCKNINIVPGLPRWTRTLLELTHCQTHSLWKPADSLLRGISASPVTPPSRFWLSLWSRILWWCKMRWTLSWKSCQTELSLDMSEDSQTRRVQLPSFIHKQQPS